MYFFLANHGVKRLLAIGVRQLETHDKDISSSCAFHRRTTKIYLCRAFSRDARQSIFKKLDFCTSFNFSTPRILFCTLYFKFIHVSVNLLFLKIMCHLKNFAVYVKFEFQVHKVME
jgi:hypothetical protein